MASNQAFTSRPRTLTPSKYSAFARNTTRRGISSGSTTESKNEM